MCLPTKLNYLNYLYNCTKIYDQPLGLEDKIAQTISLLDFHWKLRPYLRVTSGVCVDATAINNGTSLTSIRRLDVRSSMLQNSQAISISDKAFDLTHNSCSLCSMCKIHWKSRVIKKLHLKKTGLT